MALNGVRVVLGEDKELIPTLFTFPHRHHILSSTGIQSVLDPSFGSHPVLKTLLPKSTLQAPVNDTLDHETCHLHALYTLSKDVFVDQYQLSQFPSTLLILVVPIVLVRLQWLIEFGQSDPKISAAVY